MNGAGGPPPRKVLVVINPISGRRGRRADVAGRIRLASEVLGAHGVEVLVRATTAPGDAHRFARDAREQGYDTVVAWGGDGTVNEVASALVHSPVLLAIVPSGSGNGLAAELAVPFEPRAALERVIAGRTLTIDAGEVGDALFFNIAGIGIDAVIAARFAERGPNGRGLAGYLQLTSAELLRYRCQRYQLTIDGDSLDRRVMLIAFANGRQYGNRFLIAPGARLDDGLLEVVVVDEMSLLGVVRRLPSLFRGTLRPGRGVAMRAARSLTVRASAAIPFHVDGEPRIGPSELAVKSLPSALRVRV